MRSLSWLRSEVEVERQVVAYVGDAHDDAEIVLQVEPRRDVRVVVERSDDDLVPGHELARERAREEEVERRHALPERDLLGRCSRERRGLLVGEVDELVRAPRGRVRCADVGVVLAQIARNRVDHLVGALRAAGPVEEGEPALERGEPRPHRLRRRVARPCSRDRLPVDGPAVAGVTVSEAPTKQSRSAFWSSARTLSPSGAGSSVTSASTSISTKAKRPSSGRAVTVPRAFVCASVVRLALCAW